MKQKDKKISKNITYFLFSIFFLVGLFTFRDYGMWTDEEFQRFSGFYWLNYVLSFTSFDELKNIVAFKIDQIGYFSLIFKFIFNRIDLIFFDVLN